MQISIGKVTQRLGACPAVETHHGCGEPYTLRIGFRNISFGRLGTLSILERPFPLYIVAVGVAGDAGCWGYGPGSPVMAFRPLDQVLLWRVIYHTYVPKKTKLCTKVLVANTSFLQMSRDEEQVKCTTQEFTARRVEMLRPKINVLLLGPAPPLILQSRNMPS